VLTVFDLDKKKNNCYDTVRLKIKIEEGET
jgi:hypothetical protein